MRVLLVDDDSAFRTELERLLKPADFFPMAVAQGEEGLEVAKHSDFGMILLNPNLTDLSGASFLRSLRGAGVKTPVVVISGKPTNQELVQLLEAGADDYVQKPVNGDVLVARVRAVVRRSQGRADPVIICGELTYNHEFMVIEINGQALDFAPIELRIVQLLFSRPGFTFGREKIIEHVYPPGKTDIIDRTIDAYIGRIRKKIQAYTEGRDYIETVRSQGYRLRDPRA